MRPHDLPPWYTVYQQTWRWITAEVFATIAQDLRQLLRAIAGHDPQPTAAILDGRTLQSSPERGGRAGDDGAKKRRGSKIHLAVDTLGHLLVPTVTPANAQARAQVADLAEAVQVAFVDQCHTGEAAAAAGAHRIRLTVVKLPAAKRGFVLLPRRWVVERSFAWAARFRRLARDDERLAATLKGLHLLAFTIVLLRRFVTLMAEYA